MGRLGQIMFWGLLGLAGHYTLLGGEYSLFELRSAKTALAAESARLACLENVTDSLSARVAALETDDATLEEIARRDWGMIRDGEILYRFPGSVEDGPEDLDAPGMAERCGEAGESDEAGRASTDTPGLQSSS